MCQEINYSKMGFKTYPLYMFCLIILVVNMVIQVQEILNIKILVY